MFYIYSDGEIYDDIADGKSHTASTTGNNECTVYTNSENSILD
jgi:hypothetical protein